MSADDTAQHRAEAITATLLADPDPARRYDTVRLLQDGMLRQAAAASLRQLRADLGSTDAAAGAVGISRQAANELLGKAGAPGARADRDVLATSPAAAYGRWLATCRRLADSIERAAPETDAVYVWLGLESKLLAGTGGFAAASKRVLGWLAKLPAHRRAEWRDRLTERLDPITPEWLAAHRWMSPASDAAAEVTIAYHHESKRIRDEGLDHEQ